MGKTVIALLMVLCVGATANAGALRIKIHPTSGELIPFDKRACNPKVEKLLRTIVGRALYVEVQDDVMLVAASVADSTQQAKILPDADWSTAIFENTRKDGLHQTVKIKVSKKSTPEGRTVYISVFIEAIPCGETWLGGGEVL